MLSGFVLLGACTEIEEFPAAEMNVKAAGGSAAGGTSVASAGSGGRAGASAGVNGRAGVAALAAGAGAGGQSAPPPPGPPDGLAMVGSACTAEGARACAARESVMPLSCTGGKWAPGAMCAANQRCDTSLGMTQGMCQPMLALCTGKKAGDEICDSYRRRRCGADLLRFEDFDCAPNSHCQAVAAAISCVCDIGFEDDGMGACKSNVECPPAACQPGGQCVIGAGDYSCQCDAEYEGTGTKACMATGRCAQENVCSVEYTCRNRDTSYVCRGQFADWPMPSSSAGAKAAPSYMPTADTVKDMVTGLTWQRNLPETYMGCTTGCTWQKARAYCEKLELEGMSDWRLPALIELVSILDDNRVMPAIDAESFPNTPAEMFWTASSVSGATDQAWALDFNVFQSNTLPKTNSQRVRCVR